MVLFCEYSPPTEDSIIMDPQIYALYSTLLNRPVRQVKQTWHTGQERLNRTAISSGNHSGRLSVAWLVIGKGTGAL